MDSFIGKAVLWANTDEEYEFLEYFNKYKGRTSYPKEEWVNEIEFKLDDWLIKARGYKTKKAADKAVLESKALRSGDHYKVRNCSDGQKWIYFAAKGLMEFCAQIHCDTSKRLALACSDVMNIAEEFTEGYEARTFGPRKKDASDCRHPDCYVRASYNYPQDASRKYCSKHKEKGMIRL